MLPKLPVVGVLMILTESDVLLHG